MTSKQRVKGFTYERDLVKSFNCIPNTYSERMYGSNGASRGLPQEVDLIVDHFDKTYHAQAKNHKWDLLPTGFRSFCMNILNNVDMGIVKHQGMKIEKSLVVMELETLLNIMNGNNE